MINPASHPKDKYKVSHERAVGQNCRVFCLEYEVYGGSLTYTEDMGKV